MSILPSEISDRESLEDVDQAGDSGVSRQLGGAPVPSAGIFLPETPVCQSSLSPSQPGPATEVVLMTSGGYADPVDS